MRRLHRLLSSVYRDLGFDKFDIKLSTRPEVRIGTDEQWDKVEGALAGAIQSWACPTRSTRRRRVLRAETRLQADRRHRPRMAVRHLPGRPNLPTAWVRNMSARTAPSTALHAAPRHPGLVRALHRHPDRELCRQTAALAGAAAGRGGLDRLGRRSYVHEVVAAAQGGDVRAEADTRNEKINYKVREHSVGKVPVILAIGMKEVEERTVSVRRLGETRTETVGLKMPSGC
jgi:threonyl-tRNA synthetase